MVSDIVEGVELHVALVSPEIAPNTGNIIRLCANVGASLHLVEPLGFSLDDRLLKRGGLDYHELTDLAVHQSVAALASVLDGHRIFTFGSGHSERYDTVSFADGDVVMFGAERHGLPPEVAASVPKNQRLTIPMQPGNRSLNLANAVSVVAYEAWRQLGFAGAGPTGATTSETPGSSTFDS